MNAQDPLAQLHPLRDPAMTSWWPPAPGWWIITAIILLLIALVVWRLVKRYRANGYRRQALTQLAQIRTAYLANSDDSYCLSELNALLKSVALKAHPQRQVASISGRQWIDFLNQHATPRAHFDYSFAASHYQARPDNTETQDTLSRAALWIKLHRSAS